MFHALALPLPWFIAGPLMGLSVVAMYAAGNKHLGICGSFVQFADAARSRPLETWRFWFLGGILGGAALVTLLAGYPQAGINYGTLSRNLPLNALIPFLFVGGVLIGAGARWAGACTSGHGITGCSTRSTGSMVAIATFMVTAVAATLALNAVSGGAV